MWEKWKVIQSQKLNRELEIYIGCMTGTSVDSSADFTAAAFDEDGMPICFQNHSVLLPEDLRENLLALSKTDRSKTLRHDGCIAESKLTKFLGNAFQEVIHELNLTNYPKEKIILSPHGQAIAHKPNHEEFYTDIITNGPMLAQKTGYKVVTNHRQAPLVISMAAPLAPVLIKKLFYDTEQNTILLNGGGIANIAVMLKDNPQKIIGYDTGPANGPIDALIQYIAKYKLSDVPDSLKENIRSYQYDNDGQIAKTGNIISALSRQLFQHEYFMRNITKKSADRTEFGLEQWVLPSINTIELKNFSWIDIITTVSSVVADTITSAILAESDCRRESITKLIHYGGMSHNSYIIERIKTTLLENGGFEFIEMTRLNYDPDYFESLLMAYLGFCANNRVAINLSYCLRPDVFDPYAIPGTVSFPTTTNTRRDDVSLQAFINIKTKKEHHINKETDCADFKRTHGF